MKCDTIASAVVAAFKEVQPKVRSWCGWKGPTLPKDAASLQESGVNLTPATDLTDAAKKVVAAAK